MSSLHLLTTVTCIGLTLALAASIALGWVYFSFSRKLNAMQQELLGQEPVTAKLNELGEQIQLLQAGLDEIERNRTPLADWSNEPASINLTRRGQVLRMYRRGESPDQIASALGLSQGEVKLMIKVQELNRLSGKTEKVQEQPLKAPGIFDTGYTESQTGGSQTW
jgi:hypothetical protein